MNSNPGISCERVLTLLLEYVEQELAPDLQSAMDMHLSGCEECGEFLRQYRATSELCRVELTREMPAELRERLVEFIRVEIDG